MNNHDAYLLATGVMSLGGPLLLIAALWIIGRLMRQAGAAGSRDGAANTTGAAPGAFRRAGPLLTPTEALFYPVLRRAAGSCPVLCKVRLCDVAEPTGSDGRQWGLVMRQHLDFVVVDPATWRVLAAVELDDPSHQRQEAQRRDSVKSAALAAAGVPLLRVPVGAHYDAGALAGRLTPIIAGAGLSINGEGLSAVRG